MKIQDSTGYLLNVCARFMKRSLDECLKEYQITTSQFAAMQLLFQEKSPLSQAEIADKLNSDRATCGSILDKLLSKGLISKQTDQKDRRAFKVTLTERGKALIPTISSLAEETNRTTLSGFTENDKKQLHHYLNQIISNISEG